MTYFTKVKGKICFLNALYFGVEENTFKANVAKRENCEPQDVLIVEKSDINMNTCKLGEFMKLNQQMNKLNYALCKSR